MATAASDGLIVRWTAQHSSLFVVQSLDKPVDHRVLCGHMRAEDLTPRAIGLSTIDVKDCAAATELAIGILCSVENVVCSKRLCCRGLSFKQSCCGRLTRSVSRCASTGYEKFESGRFETQEFMGSFFFGGYR